VQKAFLIMRWCQPVSLTKLQHRRGVTVTIASNIVFLLMQNYQRLNYLYDKYHARGLEVGTFPSCALLLPLLLLLLCCRLSQGTAGVRRPCLH
jgi:hypothetical protein